MYFDQISLDDFAVLSLDEWALMPLGEFRCLPKPVAGFALATDRGGFSSSFVAGYSLTTTAAAYRSFSTEAGSGSATYDRAGHSDDGC